MAISDIITLTRDILSDPNADRHDDAKIIRQINLGQRDIALTTEILKSKAAIDVVSLSSTQDLPDDVLKLTRVVVNGKPIPFKSHAEMDKIKLGWELDTGDEIQYIIYDKIDFSKYRVYPMLSIDITGDGVVTSGFTTLDPYGVLATASNEEVIDYAIISYVKKPIALGGSTDNLEINDIWNKALSHYVAGNILRNDNDSASREKGAEELAIYSQELRKAQRLSEQNRVDADYESDYRRT